LRKKSSAPPGELDARRDGASGGLVEEDWLRIWAFGTSKDGLGLTAEAVWHLTPREFAALRKVWTEQIERTEYLHARMIAVLYNVNCDVNGVPFTAEDILGKGDREKRLAEKKQQDINDRMAHMRMMQMTDPRAGKMEAPDWLLGVIDDNKSKMVH
jgi:hypothetical protein